MGKNKEPLQPCVWHLLQKAVNTMHWNTSYLLSELAVVTLWLKQVIEICVCYFEHTTYDCPWEKQLVSKTLSATWRNCLCAVLMNTANGRQSGHCDCSQLERHITGNYTTGTVTTNITAQQKTMRVKNSHYSVKRVGQEHMLYHPQCSCRNYMYNQGNHCSKVTSI